MNDCRWSGTPILTMTQDKMASRVAASLLNAAGLNELITTNYQEYEELAVSLALDADRLYAMRLHIENTRDNCAAFDTIRWMKNYEIGLKAVWKHRENGMLTEDIIIEDKEPIFVVKDTMFS